MFIWYIYLHYIPVFLSAELYNYVPWSSIDFKYISGSLYMSFLIHMNVHVLDRRISDATVPRHRRCTENIFQLYLSILCALINSTICFNFRYYLNVGGICSFFAHLHIQLRNDPLMNWPAHRSLRHHQKSIILVVVFLTWIICVLYDIEYRYNFNQLTQIHP